MGRHRMPKDSEDCSLCKHEAHEEGKCYHCGIMSDPKVAMSPCTIALALDDE
jgi:hypothetical protein